MARWIGPQAFNNFVPDEATGWINLTTAEMQLGYEFLHESITGQGRQPWKLARICYELNALERMLAITVNQFQLRDRITQEQYDLETDPGTLGWSYTGNWYTFANLEALIDLVEAQFLTGGPSALGAHRSYMHELFVQLRQSLDAIVPLLWNSPPDGPGKAGVLFGSRARRLDVDGNRVAYGINLAGGGSYLDTPTGPLTNSFTWDYFSDPAPRDDYYFPTEELRTGGEGGDWNTDLNELATYRRGTPGNANLAPPDEQLLAEFNLDHGGTPLRHHQLAGYTQSNILAPPNGSGGPDWRYWVPMRPGNQVGPPSEDMPDTFRRWELDPNPPAPLIPTGPVQTNFLRNGFAWQWVASPLGIFLFTGWTRLGWETDVQSTPFSGSWWDWWSLVLGAEPDQIILRGFVSGSIVNEPRIVLGFPPGFSVARSAYLQFSASYVIGETDYDLALAMMQPTAGTILYATELTLDRAAGEGGGGVSIPFPNTFEADWSGLLQSTPMSQAIHFAAHGTFSLSAQQPNNWFYGGAHWQPLLLARFPGGQEVTLSFN